MKVVELRKYLLGKVTDEECALVEERLLIDNEYFEQVLMEENELIDDYLRGGLTRSERAQFNEVFLASPERREKLSFVRSLEQYLDGRSVEGRSHGSWTRFFDWWKSLMSRRLALAYVAAMMLASILVTWYAARRAGDQPDATPSSQAPGSYPDRLAAIEAERDELKKQLSAKQTEMDQVERQLAQLRNPATRSQTQQTPSITPSTLIFPISLISVKSAGQTGGALEIPPGKEQVRLKFDLENDSPDLFRAVLRTASGQPVKEWLKVRPELEGGLKTLNLDLPAARLKDGIYRVKLHGIQSGEPESDEGEVQFKVAHK
jgi:hypothetical protein